MDLYSSNNKISTDLKNRSVTGVKWSTLSQVFRQGAQLITTLILARLLAPSDFGLLGMAVVVTGFIAIFKDLGTSAAIIQKQDLSKELLSSIFWLNAGFGFLSTAVVFLGAPLGGLLYKNPQVVPVLRVLSVSFAISGVSILHQSLMERSLNFRALGKIEITAVFCSSFAGIGFALLGGGVWSLVVQSLTLVTVTTILLWFSSRWRPSLIFRWREVKSVSSYSLNLTGFSIFNYFSRNADYFLIGRYLGAENLGYYTLAYRILLFPLQNISAVIGRVMFPVYSSIQDDNRRFGEIYLKVAATIGFISFPLMAGVFILAKPFVLTVFGAKWEAVILLIMILAPVGLFQSIGTTVGAIYQAKGRTDWMFRWGVGTGLLLIAVFIMGLRWGITGVAGGYAIAVLLLSYPQFAIPFRLINLKVLQLAKTLAPSFANSVLMAFSLLFIKSLFPHDSEEGITFTLCVISGIAIYLLLSAIFNKKQLEELLVISGIKKEKEE